MSGNSFDGQWFRQGSHDGLCGFYATLNAVWPLVPKLHDKGELEPYCSFGKDRAGRQLFFDEAVDLLSRVGGAEIKTIKGHSLFGGIDQYQIEELVSRMARYWRRPLSTVMLHEWQHGLTTAKLLESEDKRGRFAWVASANDGGHWVTVCKIDDRFKIIDPDASTAGDHPIVSRANAPNPKEGVLIRLGNGAH